MGFKKAGGRGGRSSPRPVVHKMICITTTAYCKKRTCIFSRVPLQVYMSPFRVYALQANISFEGSGFVSRFFPLKPKVCRTRRCSLLLSFQLSVFLATFFLSFFLALAFSSFCEDRDPHPHDRCDCQCFSNFRSIQVQQRPQLRGSQLRPPRAL